MSRKEPINLLRGWPNHDLLPVQLIKHAAAQALSKLDVAHDGLEYGPDPGYGPALEAVAEWLTCFYQMPSPVTADRLNITGGASQNLACVLSVYTDPEYTRNVWLVSPSYFMGFRIFEDAGFISKMRAVPEDEEGVDIEFMERAIRESEERAMKAGNHHPKYKPDRARAKVYKHVIYCVPTFANPSGRTMSLNRREQLVKVARQYDALIIPDDVYDCLQWRTHVEAAADQKLGKAHLPRLVDIDRTLDGGTDRPGADGFGNAISNGSFSKIAGPGIRTGFMEGTPKFAYGLSQNGATASGGAPSQLTSTYVTEMLVRGSLQNHISEVLQPAYRSRYATMMDAIATHLLPLGFSCPQMDRDVAGGYFIWLGLPEGLNANVLAEHCKAEEALTIAPGCLFRIPGDEDAAALDGHLRLCFAWERKWALTEGIVRLAAATKRLHEMGDATGDATRHEDFVVVEAVDK